MACSNRPLSPPTTISRPVILSNLGTALSTVRAHWEAGGCGPGGRGQRGGSGRHPAGSPQPPRDHVPPRDGPAAQVRAHRDAGGSGPGHRCHQEAVDATPLDHPGGTFSPALCALAARFERTRIARTWTGRSRLARKWWAPSPRSPEPGRIPVRPQDRAVYPVRAHRDDRGPGSGDHRHPRAVDVTPRVNRSEPDTCPASGPPCLPGSGTGEE